MHNNQQSIADNADMEVISIDRSKQLDEKHNFETDDNQRVFGTDISRKQSMQSMVSDRFFTTNEPPSSLFDFGGDSNISAFKFEKSGSIDDITPRDHRVPATKPPKFPHTANENLGLKDNTIDEIPMTPKQNEIDPFLELETTVKASKQFHIKTPIINPFKGFLSDSFANEIAPTPKILTQGLEMDLSKESHPYDFENPFSLYNGVDASNGSSKIMDDFEELQSKCC